MRFINAYVRGTCVGEVPQEDLAALAAALLEQPVELVLTAQGAYRGGQRLTAGRRAAAALARRNIRSLLVRGGTVAEVTAGLREALTAGARDAEDALEDAGLEFNLRYSVFAAPDAVLKLQDRDLVISDNGEPNLRIGRTELREQGTRYFSSEALARLVSLEVDGVRFGAAAVTPLALQLAAGAVMEPDTASQRLQKGDWRATRKPDFVKDYCITCARCFIHCPDNAIIHAMFDKTTKDTTGVLGIDYERCTACGICASVCPANRDGYRAIVMIDAQKEGTPEVHRVA